MKTIEFIGVERGRLKNVNVVGLRKGSFRQKIRLLPEKGKLLFGKANLIC